MAQEVKEKNGGDTTAKNSADEINTELPLYLFHQGTNFKAYELLGCHFTCENGKYYYTFRTWAPNADSVCVVGDMVNWDSGCAMNRISHGIWECVVEKDKSFEGTFYKYKIEGKNGTRLKSDPYAFSSQTLRETASVITDIDKVTVRDEKWQIKKHRLFVGRKRAENHFYPSPLNIYEIHLASWRTRDGESNSDGEHYLNYRELADELVPYIKEMGYTHIELLPVAEYPFDGSWGYQITGYYAPTSRFGTPADFAYFVEKLHEAEIGIILDWVPAHFPKDSGGLFEFDGSPLYEYQGEDRMENKGWGTRCFDVGREEVQSFLISNALFWMRKYHIDGLRIDAVASMLYLDYDRKPGEWFPNKNGDNKNLEAIAFFQKLNAAVFAEFPDALMIAEESTAFPLLTAPSSDGGLGFNFKWNMGFANDMFSYISKDPIYRQYEHNKLTFPMVYAFSENFVLPVSHDEVVHGKCSLYNKMYGDYDEKFSMMRAFLTFVMTHPGKKLMFMGTEFAQVREWDYENQLEWFMLKYPRHAEMQRFVKYLNRIYLENSPLWEIDDSWEGFSWIDADRSEDNTVIYQRRDTEKSALTVIINFSPIDRNNYKFFVPEGGKYKVLINSDDYAFGGRNVFTERVLQTETVKEQNAEKGSKKHRLSFDLPAYSGIIFKRTAQSTVEKAVFDDTPVVPDGIILGD